MRLGQAGSPWPIPFRNGLANGFVPLIILDAYDRRLSTLQAGKYLEYPRHEPSQVRKSVGWCPQYQHGNVELEQILLERQVPVDSNKNVEAAFCQLQKSAVVNPRPAGFRYSFHIVSFQVSGKPSVDALVEQNSHFKSQPKSSAV